MKTKKQIQEKISRLESWQPRTGTQAWIKDSKLKALRWVLSNEQAE